jgi:hypothetical protein
MRNHDTIYVSNAPIPDLNKVLGVFENAALPASEANTLRIP